VALLLRGSKPDFGLAHGIALERRERASHLDLGILDAPRDAAFPILGGVRTRFGVRSLGPRMTSAGLGLSRGESFGIGRNDPQWVRPEQVLGTRLGAIQFVEERQR
jgi:hypothetical protein